VSLEVRRGETLGIIGRNGSGKSTLLQMICGTLTPTEGSVQTHGTVAALLELGSGFNPEFTGIENVYLNALLHGLSREQTEERLEDIQAFADIGEFIHQPVRTYSSGMLVRLAFAVIAHVDASVLIVDEALSVGDAVFGQRCMRFIRRFKEAGTLLFVSHDMNAVSSLCE
jgi:lipopolysaccharide transport system ATP-binding protein